MSFGDAVAANGTCPLAAAICEPRTARFDVGTDLSRLAGGWVAWPRAAANRMKHSVKRAMEKPSFARMIAPFRAVESVFGTKRLASSGYDESGTTRTSSGGCSGGPEMAICIQQSSETPAAKRRRLSFSSLPTHLQQGFRANAG